MNELVDGFEQLQSFDAEAASEEEVAEQRGRQQRLRLRALTIDSPDELSMGG